jgi:hypothetical protein
MFTGEFNLAQPFHKPFTNPAFFFKGYNPPV